MARPVAPRRVVVAVAAMALAGAMLAGLAALRAGAGVQLRAGETGDDRHQGDGRGYRDQALRPNDTNGFNDAYVLELGRGTATIRDNQSFTTLSAGGSLSLYSTVRAWPPPYQGKPNS